VIIACLVHAFSLNGFFITLTLPKLLLLELLFLLLDTTFFFGLVIKSVLPFFFKALIHLFNIFFHLVNLYAELQSISEPCIIHSANKYHDIHHAAHVNLHTF